MSAAKKKRKLRGNYYVYPTGAAIRDAQRLFPGFRDYQLARRHAKKLMFWPTGEDPANNMVFDLDVEVINQCKQRIWELRIGDTIGGHNNLRAIFWVADKILPGDPLPRIWILAALQKRFMAFTARDVSTFDARLSMLKVREYENIP